MTHYQHGIKSIFLDFLEFLNTIHVHPSIKWTNEIEEGNELAIFDIQIIRTEVRYETTLCRKQSAVSIQTGIFATHHHKNGEFYIKKPTQTHQNKYGEFYIKKPTKTHQRKRDFAKSMYVPSHPRTKRSYK